MVTNLLSTRGRPVRARTLAALGALLVPAVAWASGGEHGVGALLLGLALFLGMAKVGADLAQRLGQPAVLGELCAGIALGNLSLLGVGSLEPLANDPVLSVLAEIGVILVLFEVGLESTLAQMMRVGGSALLVAIIGVIAPFLLGVGTAHLLLPDASVWVHTFVGATLTATSVGITARVLKDLGRSTSAEARVILGAAVVDDVLGLVILAAVSAVIAAVDKGATPAAGPIVWIVVKALAFLVGAVGIGALLTPTLFRGAAKLKGGGVLLGVSLAFCFFVSWVASVAGLAPIVGAFAAGLVLEAAHYKPFAHHGQEQLEELIRPVTGFLGPVFFVLMGFRVDLSVFADTSVLLLAGALTIAAVIGKQASVLGVLDRKIARLPVGIGMIPRGEVGLIFANIGLTLKVAGKPLISPSLFGAIVIMVVLTTLVTPPLLAAALRRVPSDQTDSTPPS